MSAPGLYSLVSGVQGYLCTAETNLYKNDGASYPQPATFGQAEEYFTQKICG